MPTEPASADLALLSRFHNYLVQRLVLPLPNVVGQAELMKGQTRDVFELEAMRYAPVRSKSLALT
jgi:hypothetical protein